MARPSLARQSASRIVAFIQSEAIEAGQHLPSQRLADALRVSRAPVNAGLKLLEKDGIVRFEPNRGYFLAASPTELRDRPAATASTPEPEDELYAALVEDCLAGRLPERVSENELGRLYGLPRQRVLTTLYRIQNEGWAERRPGNGWEFLPRMTSRTSYVEAYQFRASIESQALLLPTFSVDREAFAQARQLQQEMLDGGYERMQRARLFEINSSFHEMLVGCGGNPFFTDALARVNRLRRLLEYKVTIDRSRLPLQCREHLLILDLVESGDRLKASEFLRTHILGASAIKSPAVRP